MVGLLILALLLAAGSGGGEDCGKFKPSICNLGLDNILFLDNSSGGPAECQMGCFNRTSCEAFTFFTGEEQRCILFKSCEHNTAPCKGCVSGPVYPRGGNCFQQILDVSNKNTKTVSSTVSVSRSAIKSTVIKSPRSSLTSNPKVQSPFFSRDTKSSNVIFGTNRPARPQSSLRKLRPANSVPVKKPRCLNDCQSQTGKETKVYNVDNGLRSSSKDDAINFPNDLDDEDDLDDDDLIDIDDGLLDDVYESLPTNNKNREPITSAPRRTTQSTQWVTSPPRRPTGLTPSFTQVLPRRRQTPHTYCIMGGRNKNGPVAGISILPTSNRWPLRSRSARSPIGSFPSSMTRGSGRSFSTFSNQALNTCTPGYPVVSHFGTTYVPGSCNNYNFQTRQWSPSGGQMTTFRQGGSTLRMGKYLMTFGGVSHQYGHPINSVDIFDPRRPNIGWRTVPQWSFPSAAQDQCTVVTKDPNGGTQVMVMGGVGQETTAMKLVVSRNQWFSVNPMLTPRSQHACTKVTLNNRPGVVVSGGVNGHNQNMSSVDFFDIHSGRWVSLPGLSRGRRGHTMTSLDGKLAVLGGSATTVQGDTEYLNDVEMFNGREWKPARIRMDQPRDGANIVKIPNHLIF